MDQHTYKGMKSCVLQNRLSLDYIYPQKGCRQGYSISPFLFLLCAESLGTIIRNNKDMKGIKIGDVENKWSQNTDDSSLISDGSPLTFDGILRELDFFKNISGLKN